jgi:hypothetical protein
VFSDGDLRIRVEDQVSEGDRVASRWIAEGHNSARGGPCCWASPLCAAYAREDGGSNG